jgi:acetyl esterase/lipase
MKHALHTIVILVLATTLSSIAQQPQGRPGRPGPVQLPEGTRSERDLVYGSANGRELKLNLYLPPGDEVKPLIIWIHGGAWMMGSKDGPSPAQQFLAFGYAVAHVGYRLSQVAKWPAQMHDCKAAVRWLRANAEKYHLDPKRFAAWGSSAGGHLVAVLGTSGGVPEFEGTGNDVKASSSVQAVVDWFGPTDFLQMNKFRSNIAHDEARSPESQLIGGPIQENKDAAAKANPIAYIGRFEAPPPFLIMHGTRDELVPFNQSELLRDALQAAHANVTLYPVNNAGHGFGGEQNIAPVREFLARVLATTDNKKSSSEKPARDQR